MTLSMAHGPGQVLVVDDERDACANLRDILQDCGYRVDVAHDGRAAANLILKCDYDVALLDFKLPDMDGLELSRLIQCRRAATVSILVTAHAGRLSSEEVSRSGAARVVSKPIDVVGLLQILAQLAPRDA